MKSSRIAISFIALLLLIWLLNRASVNIRTKAVGVAEPAFKAANKILHKITPSPDPMLETKIKIMEARLAGMHELSLENERLRKLLGFSKKSPPDTIPAEVIGRDPSNWTNIVYIDKGESEGITPETGIASGEGVAGRVIETGESISKVMLINDPDSRIAARVQRSREEGLVSGTFSHRCRMIYLSLDADVRIGDVVVTSGSSKVFSEGLLIGKIVDLFEDKTGLYRSAIIQPSADLRRLEEVLCIK